jgi:hypothetical protein
VRRKRAVCLDAAALAQINHARRVAASAAACINDANSRIRSASQRSNLDTSLGVRNS